MARPQNCKKCHKFIANEPGRSAHCLVCLEKLRKAREITWVKTKLEANGEIAIVCEKCGVRVFFENHREPIKASCAKITRKKRGGVEVEEMASTIDRLNFALENFRKAHRHGHTVAGEEPKAKTLNPEVINYIVKTEKVDGKKVPAPEVCIRVKDLYQVQVSKATVRKIWRTGGKGTFREYNPKRANASYHTARGYSKCSVYESGCAPRRF